jgi:multiple sugar transport system substrate-binding protein
VALALWLIGCERALDGTTVIEFWGLGREGEVVQRLVPEFERRHPEIRVRVQQVPWSAAHEKLLTAFVGEAMPDLFQLGNTWIPEFVALNALEPLDPWIARSQTVKAEDYFPGILDTNRIEGRTYGLPWYVDTRLIFYRRDLLAQAGYPEPPTSWPAWLDAMQRVKHRAAPGHYALLAPINEWQLPVILALQQGARLLRENGQYGDFQAPAFRKALSYYLSVFDQGLAPPRGEAQIGNLYQDFAEGYFAMLITGPWNLGEFSRRLPARMQDLWATAPLPSPEGDTPGISIAGGASLAVHRGSAHKAAAWRFIEYLSTPEQQMALYRLSGDLPAHRAAWADPLLRDNPRAAAFRAQLQHVQATPKVPEWERIAAKIVAWTEALIRNRSAPEPALRSLDVEVDGVLAKRRWMLRRAREAAP